MGHGIGKSIKYYFECLLDVLYGNSEGCILCNNPTEELICDSCEKKINFSVIEGHIQKENIKIKYYSCSYYNALVKEMIIGLKYKSDFNCGRVLVGLMKKLVLTKGIDAEYVTFVPSDSLMLKKRGYNQSEFLCKQLCQALDKTFIRCLSKQHITKDQIGLDGEGRWLNLKSSFTATNVNKIKGKKILLIDDVITTGATAFYCGKALLEKGCNEVIVLTVAKSAV
ncbi:MAG: ComF family protein [Clostridiales bacterium]|uniref:ComF family protein n=1 Tax=Clostridium sp. N3C TaxID=1776758 RepID=UPI00092E012E|nr:ComF family protein [Clostridium sp. N3C]NLZ47244.1 ComF family protein [Clostridiales bacterium]SCN24983.1 DNA utilization protein GntX [Clostridium sp. N3C]